MSLREEEEEGSTIHSVAWKEGGDLPRHINNSQLPLCCWSCNWHSYMLITVTYIRLVHVWYCRVLCFARCSFVLPFRLTGEPRGEAYGYEGNIVERILVQNYPGRGHRRWFPKGALTVVALFSVRQMHYDVGGAAEGLVFI